MQPLRAAGEQRRILDVALAEFKCHRFWAQAAMALALAEYARLLDTK